MEEQLFQCASSGLEVKLSNLLADNPEQANTVNTLSDQTLLFTAARNGHVGVVQMLLDRFGAEVNQRNTRSSLTPLHGACYGGFPRVVEVLLSRGAKALPTVAGEYPMDMLQMHCIGKTKERCDQCMLLLQQSGQCMTRSEQPRSQSTPSTPMVSPQGSQIVLPWEFSELLRYCKELRVSLRWRLVTQTQYSASGSVPYPYKGGTYLTPVDIFYDATGSSNAEKYRCRIDMKKIDPLCISSNANYIDAYFGVLSMVVQSREV